jgi:hemoglobin
MSLYDDLGGSAAIQMALGKFYPKVLADPRTRPYFEHVDIERLKKRVEPFLAMALGGPSNYRGPGLRQSHARMVAEGLDDNVFDAFLGHFADVLTDLGVPAEKLAEIVPIFQGARSDVLNR